MEEFKRMILKVSDVENDVATIPSTNDHTDGSWLNTDIYEGELFLNVVNNILQTRTEAGIVTLYDGAGTSVNWGDILGTLSDQTDLQNALNEKINYSDYTPSHSLLVQQSGTGSPTSLSVGNETLVGRLSGAGSEITDLSIEEVKELLNFGTGTTNYVSKWIDSDTIGNSQIFDNGTNVGIGISNPDRDFHLHKDTLPDIHITNTASGAGAGDGATLTLDSLDFLINNRESGNLRLFTSGAEKMRITSDGNVGIRTTSPSEALDVVGNFKLKNEAPIIYVESTNNYSGIRFDVIGTATSTHRFLYNGQTLLQMNSNGNVGIGTTAPATELDVVGAITVNDGNNNTKVGTDAGQGYTGTNQSAFGRGAGNNNTGANQSAVGLYAGRSNTGNDQSAVGYSAGRGNTGDNQSAVGYAAGQNNSGYAQSVFGREAGRDNTEANQSAVGYAAGQNNSGANQSVFGREAGQNNTGINQSAVGAYAGLNNTGDLQSAVGYFAGSGNSGNNQSAVGRSAGRNNTGDNNSNFGYESGYRLSDGTTVNTGSSDSVFLGSNTKALGASQTNQIVIGHNTTGNGSNSVTLGNDSITKTVLRGNVSTDGSVQVGDNTDTANASNVGAMRYRTDGSGSYADMCMATDSAGTYEWINIVTNLF